jgi:two-component system response regulator NreC
VTTRLLLAYEMVMLRQALKVFLETQGIGVVAETSDRHEIIKLAQKHTPDVAVVDTTLTCLNGLRVVRDLQSACPFVGLILLTMPGETPRAPDALRSGVRGLLLKTQAAEDLVFAIREVRQGGICISSGVSKAVLPIHPPTPHRVLSPRESDVLKLVAEGKSTKQVAALLGVSVKTAAFHRDRLMRKLNIHETAGLVRYAIRNGVIIP